MRLSESRWYKGKTNQAVLQKILDTPEFREAMAIVLEKNTPVLTKGEHGLTDNALENAFQSGLKRISQDLELLAHPTPKILLDAGVRDIPPLGRPWSHYDVEKTSFPVDPETGDPKQEEKK